MNKKKFIQHLLEQQILVSPDLLNTLPEEIDATTFLKTTQQLFKTTPLILNKDLFTTTIPQNTPLDINWSDFDTSRTQLEKGKHSPTYNHFLDLLTPEKTVQPQPIQITEQTPSPQLESRVKIIQSYN